jgi:hypothetical protein
LKNKRCLLPLWVISGHWKGLGERPHIGEAHDQGAPTSLK